MQHAQLQEVPIQHHTGIGTSQAQCPLRRLGMQGACTRWAPGPAHRSDSVGRRSPLPESESCVSPFFQEQFLPGFAWVFICLRSVRTVGAAKADGKQLTLAGDHAEILRRAFFRLPFGPTGPVCGPDVADKRHRLLIKPSNTVSHHTHCCTLLLYAPRTPRRG
jgi:hypothetical protein